MRSYNSFSLLNCFLIQTRIPQRRRRVYFTNQMCFFFSHHHKYFLKQKKHTHTYTQTFYYFSSHKKDKEEEKIFGRKGDLNEIFSVSIRARKHVVMCDHFLLNSLFFSIASYLPLSSLAPLFFPPRQLYRLSMNHFLFSSAAPCNKSYSLGVVANQNLEKKQKKHYTAVNCLRKKHTRKIITIIFLFSLFLFLSLVFN